MTDSTYLDGIAGLPDSLAQADALTVFQGLACRLLIAEAKRRIRSARVRAERGNGRPVYVEPPAVPAPTRA